MNCPSIVSSCSFAIVLAACSSPTAYRSDETAPANAVNASDGALSMLGEPQGQLDQQLTCSAEESCFHTGCLNEVCATEVIVTSCEVTCESGCYAQAQCDCRGIRCGFRMTRELAACLRACGVPPNPFPPAS